MRCVPIPFTWFRNCGKLNVLPLNEISRYNPGEDNIPFDKHGEVIQKIKCQGNPNIKGGIK